MSDSANGLAALQARLREDLEWLELPARRWGRPRQIDGEEVLEVAIIGAGMAGLAVAASLTHLGVQARLFDQAPRGYEGPWATTARMQTLRSPKQLTGPALGLPALTFRAWYQAQHGLDGWQALDKIPRLVWADYLRWYRQVLDLDVHNEQRISAVLPRADGCVELQVDSSAGRRRVLARHLVIASGRDGLGGRWLPAIARQLPEHCWAHSADGLQDAWFAGKRVAVIGAGASAMDSAATALEAGAARVDVLVRRPDLVRINKGKGMGSAGTVHGFWRLPDDWKWRLRHYLNTQAVPPPQGSTLRVSAAPNARLLFDAPIERLTLDADGTIQLRTPAAELRYDFLVFATGFCVDWSQRPEYAAIEPHIRRWGDRYEARPGEEDEELRQSPDLGQAFEFQQRTPGACPGLERVHCFTYPAALNHGTVSGDIPAISEGAQRLSRALVASLYGEDIEEHFAAAEAFSEPELQGDEWQVGQLTAEERRR
ncbi:MAG: FAD-dependent urate hydroxylase [Stenotrophomonas maltophilia]|nr:MAG: FAD-dependent urate hydroxylase [Stenotrophomonas maltophilia]